MTEDRSVLIEVALAPGESPKELEEKLRRLCEAIADRGGVPVRSLDGRRYGARFCVRAPDPAAAVDGGVEAFEEAAGEAGLPSSPVVEVETVTIDELAADDDEEAQLLGVTELAALLGVGEHLATLLVRAQGFPPPVAELAAGPVWARDRVERFLRIAAGAPAGGEDAEGA